MAFKDDIKKVLDKHGYDIMRNIQIANILSDTSEEFCNNPSLRNVFKEFIREGYGSKIIDIQDQDDCNKSLALKQFTTSFVTQKGYSADTVEYIVNGLAYALGWGTNVCVTSSAINMVEDSPQKCPKCGTEYTNAKLKFCPSCRVRLIEVSTVTTCPQCSEQLDQPDFCPYCGWTLPNAETTIGQVSVNAPNNEDNKTEQKGKEPKAKKRSSKSKPVSNGCDSKIDTDTTETSTSKVEPTKKIEVHTDANILYIKDGIKDLKKWASDSKLKKGWKNIVNEIHLPSSLKMIDETILNELPLLTKIVIPTGEKIKFCKLLPNNWWRIYYEDGSHVIHEYEMPYGELCIFPYGVKTIRESAFSGNTNIANSLLIPDTCVEIGKNAFKRTNITNVFMPDSIFRIGDKAFRECNSLTHIRFSNNLKVIPKYILQNCKSIREISIPTGVKTLGEGAFCGCINLHKVTLPSTITTIESGGTFGFNPFHTCPSLDTIIIPKGTKKKFVSLLKGLKGNPAQFLVEKK